MKTSKLLKRACDQLNGIICSRNLYRNGRRFINAHSSGIALCVEDLYTGESVLFANDGSFVDGNGAAIFVDTAT